MKTPSNFVPREVLRLSPSGIRRFENCKASHLYYKIIPRIENPHGTKAAHVGSKFHDWAQHDFSDEMRDVILKEEQAPVLDLIETYQAVVETREYFGLPAINELEVWGPVGDAGVLWGYADRIGLSLEKHRLYVIDYKTAAMPDPYADRKQLLGYAYDIATNLDLREEMKDKLRAAYADREDIDALCGLIDSLVAEDIVLLLDYVKADEVYEFNVTERDLKIHENYLLSIFYRVRKLEAEFAEHQNINRVEHTDGNCGFCYMKGVCRAFHIVRTARFDPVEDELILRRWKEFTAIPRENDAITEIFAPVEMHSFDAGTPVGEIESWFRAYWNVEVTELEKEKVVPTTESMIAELLDKLAVVKNYEERTASLKRALLARHEQGDPVVEQHLHVVQGQDSSFPRDKVLDYVVPRMVKKAVKNVRFAEMLDFKTIEKGIVDLLSQMLPQNLSRTSIPKDLHAKVEPFKIWYNKKAYLRPRK